MNNKNNNMKNYLSLIALSLLVASYTMASPNQSAIQDAQAITKVFATTLKSELQKAMKSGGPINALSVCNKKAPAITKKIAREKGVQISRVSLKNRNPKNTPNDWQAVVLKNFDARAAKRENVNKLSYAKIVNNKGQKQLRFMKAIPTGKLCLKCHGTNVDDEIQIKLAKLYPEDNALGYKLGQIRGAIVVIKNLK